MHNAYVVILFLFDSNCAHVLVLIICCRVFKNLKRVKTPEIILCFNDLTKIWILICINDK